MKYSISDNGGSPILVLPKPTEPTLIRRATVIVGSTPTTQAPSYHVRVSVSVLPGADGLVHARLRVSIPRIRCTPAREVILSCKGHSQSRVLAWLAEHSAFGQCGLPADVVSGIIECCNSL